ncbi:MAG: signal peptidase I [Legionellales bacterium]|nr:signal peptidase I [Legionellales bacterium]|tara:strand:- start:4090 stop:4887 length:798 start_codon:yes stop_codon:yes gene_type:complete
MNFDFAFYLTMAVILTGLISLLDIAWLSRRRAAKAADVAQAPTMPKLIEYSRSFFPVLLIVLVIRSFIFQPYHVPTGSLEPTVMPGDLIAVQQYAYGLRLPVINKKIINISEPKIGDIVVFRAPFDSKMDLVKRVVGTPGDHVVYKDKVLYVNGIEATQTLIGPAVDEEPAADGGNRPVLKKSEDLNGVVHDILVMPEGGLTGDVDVTVPEGQYFMMGDNRDNSGDSRSWGFAPQENLIGRAFWVFMSWDSEQHRIRFQRIGTTI